MVSVRKYVTYRPSRKVLLPYTDGVPQLLIENRQVLYCLWVREWMDKNITWEKHECPDERKYESYLRAR